MRAIGMALGLLLLLAATAPASAKDDGLEKAKELAKGDDRREAAEHFARLFSKAANKKDLVEQYTIAKEMIRSLGRYSGDAQRGNKRYIACLRVLFDNLSTKKDHAFLCKPRMASMMLMQASQTGDADHGAAVAAYCAKAAKAKGAGAYLGFLATYARGLSEVAQKESDKACASLAKALSQAIDQAWTTMSFHVGTELAARHLEAGRTEQAAAALKQVADGIPTSFDKGSAQYWMMLVNTRLPGASEEVLAAYKGFADKYLQGGSARATGGAGGAGAPGASGGSASKSPLEKALEKFSRKKALVSVTRVKDGFEVTLGFDKSYKETVRATGGVHHHQAQGITLSFWGTGVRVNMIDPTGRDGAPGTSSAPRHYELFRPLAKGETWSMTRDGVISIR